MDVKHYNQKPVRDAQYITPPNIIKAKVGSGGLSEAVLNRAQTLLENNNVDFGPLAEIYLGQMLRGIEHAEETDIPESNTNEQLIAGILYPCVQLKANGGMFHYTLVTRVADRFVQFMEVVDRLDKEVFEIARAFHATIRIIVSSKISGDGGSHGDALVSELNGACMRYFEKHKATINFKKD